ncbi:MAG: 50S ribosomal protein L17 [bacterium]|nr:50S ribosomal protein L17 [bacterium]
MRKNIRAKKFSRPSSQRGALLRSLARSIVLHGKITTTETKAKEASRVVERMVTRAKKGDLASRRYLSSAIGEEQASKLVETIAPQFSERSGGYTRVVKRGPRKSDGARMAIVEFVK